MRTSRAILYNATRSEIARLPRAGVPDFAADLRGGVESVYLVNPEQAEALRSALTWALTARPD